VLRLRRHASASSMTVGGRRASAIAFSSVAARSTDWMVLGRRAGARSGTVSLRAA
jgi:hypothetical protein